MNMLSNFFRDFGDAILPKRNVQGEVAFPKGEIEGEVASPKHKHD